MEPASIRCKNPGAMWGRVGHKPATFFATSAGPHGVETNAPIPLKWGSTKTIYLSDGLGQDNNIAIFDTYVQGICAQIELWRTSPKYKNKRFADAIAIWAGGNNVPSYIALVEHRVPGMTGDTVMDDTFWRGPMAVPFLKAQSSHEAGEQYPASDSDWLEAQRIVFSGVVPPSSAEAEVSTTPKPAASVHTLVEVGSSGPDVAKMQGLLGVVQTARYEADSETQFALQLFQVRNGLDPDGRCGDLTWGKLIVAQRGINK